MPEQEQEPKNLSEYLVQEAVRVFKTNDSFDDEKGWHANTIDRSAQKALEKVFVSPDVNAFGILEELMRLTPENMVWRHINQANPITPPQVPTILAEVVAEELRVQHPKLMHEEIKRIERFRTRPRPKPKF